MSNGDYRWCTRHLHFRLGFADDRARARSIDRRPGLEPSAQRYGLSSQLSQYGRHNESTRLSSINPARAQLALSEDNGEPIGLHQGWFLWRNRSMEGQASRVGTRVFRLW